MDQEAIHLACAFADLSRRCDTHVDGDAAAGVVELAARTLPGCDMAAITAPGRSRPIAASDPVLNQLAFVQCDTASGPALHAHQGHTLVAVDDLRTDQRWPAFTRRITAETTIRSVLSMPVSSEPPLTLSLASTWPGAFDTTAQATASVFAVHARALLARVHAEQRSAHLTTALDSSRRIAMAIGIMMGTHSLTEDQAWSILKRASQDHHIKIRDIAERILTGAELPKPPLALVPGGPAERVSGVLADFGSGGPKIERI